jgi:hypothetical protein
MSPSDSRIAFPSMVRRTLSLVAGMCLVIGGCVGLVYSLRAHSAQWTYHDLKFSGVAIHFEEADGRARDAQALYPFNYRLCDWMASQAWDRYDSASKTRSTALSDVGDWTGNAIALNPYPRSICEIRRKYLEETSLTEAIRYWSEFVEWSFWDPYNHAVLLELHVRTRNLDGALSEMKWVRNSPYAPRAVEFIQGLLEREFTVPSSPH